MTREMAKFKTKTWELKTEKKLLNHKQMQSPWYKESSVSNSSLSPTCLQHLHLFPSCQTLLHCFLCRHTLLHRFPCHHGLLHHFPCHHILLRLFPYCHALLHLFPCRHTLTLTLLSMWVLLVIRKSLTHYSNRLIALRNFLPPNCAEPTDFDSYSPQLPNHLTLSLLGCQVISIFAKASPDVTGTGEAC